MWDGGYTRGGGSDRIWLVEVDEQPLLIHVLLQRADPRPDIGAIIGSIAIGDRRVPNPPADGLTAGTALPVT